jgi:exosome complex component RRP45
VTVYGVREREPVPLALLHWPLCVSVWALGGASDTDRDAGESALLLDLTLREEQVCEGEVLVAANREGEVCQIKKLGGAPAGAVALLRCVDVALSKVKELCAIVQRALEKDAKRRDPGGLMAELRAENER